MAARPPARGDVVRVEWVDIYEDPTGDPAHATLSHRSSCGMYYGESESHGVPVVVTTTTEDKDGDEHSGFCCYPKACVLALHVVKRKARAKKA